MGVYDFFIDHVSAEAYYEKHTSRLKGRGVDEIGTQIIAVNPALTAMNHGPL
ncbi:YdhR family protein [Halomonas llamarensis]|uniref:YdhR family protein n=1 Tax=Halomonas llamarensis TaxID=2945104 RepID=A0ABT0SRY0_9GAMM|nr:YdhR family protein [Halomonas llamarensis]MCL7930579.1 YdhR family protein [Halomonas llamarensis]